MVTMPEASPMWNCSIAPPTRPDRLPRPEGSAVRFPYSVEGLAEQGGQLVLFAGAEVGGGGPGELEGLLEGSVEGGSIGGPDDLPGAAVVGVRSTVDEIARLEPADD